MIAFRLAAAVSLGLAFALPASAGTSLVVDAASGEVLSSENPSQAWHPASTTKMMTAYLALKAVRERRLGLETAIPASKLAASQPRVKVYIRAGQEVTLDNALRIMMVKSANDIAYVIAEGVGGDVPTFVSMMNAEAQRLGMRDTYFVNPNGWHHPDQQTSARDLAILAMALMREFPDYADYWNTAAVQLGKQVLNNTNGLVGRYSGIGGMKTGFVCASGFNVVATATRGGRTLIAVVLGALSGADRTIKAAQLLDDGFGKWGGFGYTAATLPSGNGGRAQSVCDDVRRKGGGGALADDVDVAGPIGAQPASGLGGNAEGTSDRFPIFSPQPAAASAVLARAPSGRIVLGPRAQTMPVLVAFGRTPGSANAPLAANAVGRPDSLIARGDKPALPAGLAASAGLVGVAAARTVSGNGGIPGTSSAFAPATDDLASGRSTGGPLRLQGAIQAGAATATSLTPGAAAGIRGKPVPARPLLAKPKPQADVKAAANTQPGRTQPGKTQQGKTLQGKAQPAKAAAAPQARSKPSEKPKTKPDDT